jgi:hypothetical protein
MKSAKFSYKVSDHSSNILSVTTAALTRTGFTIEEFIPLGSKPPFAGRQKPAGSH